MALLRRQMLAATSIVEKQFVVPDGVAFDGIAGADLNEKLSVLGGSRLQSKVEFAQRICGVAKTALALQAIDGTKIVTNPVLDSLVDFKGEMEKHSMFVESHALDQVGLGCQG